MGHSGQVSLRPYFSLVCFVLYTSLRQLSGFQGIRTLCILYSSMVRTIYIAGIRVGVGKNVHVKFNYDRLRIDKALGICDNNNKNKNNVRIALGVIGVGAQSTLGGHDIFARKICMKN